MTGQRKCGAWDTVDVAAQMVSNRSIPDDACGACYSCVFSNGCLHGKTHPGLIEIDCVGDSCYYRSALLCQAQFR